MRAAILGAFVCGLCWAGTSAPAPDGFESLKSLQGNWRAQLPGFGAIDNTIRLVSGGKAVEETIGTPAENEVSIYTLNDGRLLLAHFCAMTNDGHVVRLQSGPLRRGDASLQFEFLDATNLHDAAAPHMRHVSMTFIDRDHFEEKWTKIEKGVETEFDLKFARQSK